jgi:hypothetical protein
MASVTPPAPDVTISLRTLATGGGSYRSPSRVFLTVSLSIPVTMSSRTLTAVLPGRRGVSAHRAFRQDDRGSAVAKVPPYRRAYTLTSNQLDTVSAIHSLPSSSPLYTGRGPICSPLARLLLCDLLSPPTNFVRFASAPSMDYLVSYKNPSLQLAGKELVETKPSCPLGKMCF